MVRAKFQLVEVRLHANSVAAGDRTLVFEARYDPTIPEDMVYQKFTPQGRFEMYCNNPMALAQLMLGKSYYFDIQPVPEP